MIVQEIYLSKYNWTIKVYYAVDKYYQEEILEDLQKLGPTITEYYKAKDLLEGCKYNCGFTFTNTSSRETLVMIGLTTSPSEFQDTFDHEKGHAAVHIAQHLNIDPYSEDFQYLNGLIGKKLFPVAKKFLCSHCKDKLNDLFFTK